MPSTAAAHPRKMKMVLVMRSMSVSLPRLAGALERRPHRLHLEARGCLAPLVGHDVDLHALQLLRERLHDHPVPLAGERLGLREEPLGLLGVLLGQPAGLLDLRQAIGLPSPTRWMP